ncbi:AraC family transcriptional regulator [Bacteroides salyersiae]|uniref:AraC family transcriptional regulator n=1 Tax=Bacteroides salyersiae TaxID=291644 RepID=UPI00189A199F|nr:AraC family transcriptional regulator [Bacteroides salyersiae]
MISPKATRLMLNMKKHEIDVFDEFGRYNYINTQKPLPSHTHPSMIEICYLAKGNQEYFVGDQTFKLYGGDVFITFPDEVHGTGEIPEKKGVLYWLVLKRPEEGKDYLGLNHIEAETLFTQLLQLPQRHFKGDNTCEELLKRVINLYFSDQNTLTKIELNNLLVAFLLQIIRMGQERHARAYSQCIAITIDYIEKNLFETIDLEKMADKCNLSLSRFKHLFKKETGIPPSEYIIRKKIEKAQILLEEQNLSVKDIAYDLGFSSSAYFSTVFKQYNGCSPTEYLKLNK